MPWSGPTFTRTNGFFTGATVWQSDYNAAVKIVYSRHDTHDQDLAQGINACLNKNGLNSPTTNISWGGFKITNMAAGSATADSARTGQTITALSIDPASKILTATRADGNVTVDLTPIVVAGDTSDFARYSAASNPFTGPATFGGTLGCDYAIQMLDMFTVSGSYTWALTAVSTGHFQIARSTGTNNTLDFYPTSTSARLEVGGNIVLTDADLDVSTVITASSNAIITGNWAFEGTSLQLPPQVVLTGSGYSWAFTAPSPNALQMVGSGGAYLKITPDTAHTSELNVSGNVVWNSSNLAVVTAAPVNPAGNQGDIAIVTTGADQGVWVKLAGTGWTKIV